MDQQFRYDLIQAIRDGREMYYTDDEDRQGEDEFIADAIEEWLEVRDG